MSEAKKEHPKEKAKIHPRSKHRERYNFDLLIAAFPALKPFVHPNKYGDRSVDFFNPEAVRMLNNAILKLHYGIEKWDLPKGFLSPPIPGRADYIHHIADLLAEGNNDVVPTGDQIKVLDIGTGASCIYPLIGTKAYGWSFVGTDIDILAVNSCNRIIAANPEVKDKIEIREQRNWKDIFYEMIKENERFDLTICNPPFHGSQEEAEKGTLRKLNSLKREKVDKVTLNFGGKSNELWTKGGEKKFVRDMVRQSKQFRDSCLWFSTLVSKESNLKSIYEALKKVGPDDIKTIEMGQGHKKSRIVAWTFLNRKQQKEWIASHRNK